MEQSSSQNQAQNPVPMPAPPPPPQTVFYSPAPSPVNSVLPQPHFEQPTGGDTPSTHVVRSHRKIAIMLGCIFFFFLVITVSGLCAIAYGYVPFSNLKVKTKIAQLVMAVPFMPKTPEYVLSSALAAHQQVTRFVLDASLAATIPNSGILPIGGALDVQVKGPVDYTDPEKPMVDLHINVTKQFDVDVIAKDYKTYVRIMKIPPLVSGMLIGFGIPENIQQELVNKWMVFDSKPLDTEARKNLSEKQKKSPTETIVEDSLVALNDPEIIKSLKLTSEKLGAESMYHVHFQPSDSVLDVYYKKYTKQSSKSMYASQSKISDTIKQFSLDMWINKQTFLNQKTTVSFTYHPYSFASSSTFTDGLGTSQNKDIPVSLVMNFSHHGKQAFITAPTDSVSFEDVFKHIMEEAAQQNGGSAFGVNSSIQLAQANNTKRRSDINAILNSVNQYTADNRGAIPVGISATPKEVSSTGVNLCKSVVPVYISALPVDPTLGGGPITTCKTVYATGYFIQKDPTGRITVSAKYAESGETISVTR